MAIGTWQSSLHHIPDFGTIHTGGVPLTCILKLARAESSAVNRENPVPEAPMALRSVDRSLVAAVKLTVAAIDPPETDLALVRLAETIAETIDAMALGQRETLLPQHSGQLARVLAELEARAVKRRAPVQAAPAAAAVNPLDELRKAHSRQVGRRLS